MLTIYFQGWWQLRMAMDPDPNDEPHGISGKTFTVPGEPPFDRIIRLQNPVIPRFPHENDVGVSVYRLTLDDSTAPGGVRDLPPNHPLMNAKVDLLDNPQYDERGFVVVYQKMPIVPFHLRIEGDTGVVLDREDYWDITRMHLTYDDVVANFPALLERRSVVVQAESPVVAEATGVMNYAEYRLERRETLEEMAKHTDDPIKRAGYEKRVRNLKKDDEGMSGLTLPAQQFLGLCGYYSFAINGPPTITNPENRLGGKIGTSQVWPLSFWMGGYDVDALCGYMRGTLQVPFWPDA